MRSSFFWDVTLYRLIVIYQSFATTYQCHLQGWPFVDVTYRLSQRSVNNYLFTPLNTPEERRISIVYILLPILFIISCKLLGNEDLPHSLLFRDFKHLGSLDHLLDDGLFRLVQRGVLTSTERLQLPRLHRPPRLQPTQKHTYPLMKQKSFKDNEISDCAWLPVWPITPQTTSYNMLPVAWGGHNFSHVRPEFPIR